MSLARIYGNMQGIYLDLIRTFPLRPIRSEAELDEAIATIDALIDKDMLAAAEADYLAVLSDLVEHYEEETLSLAPASDTEMLRHLLEVKGLTAVEVARETGIIESTISAVLTGQSHLTQEHVDKLSRYFKVSPSVFAIGD